jgi:hypothetical protein
MKASSIPPLSTTSQASDIQKSHLARGGPIARPLLFRGTRPFVGREACANALIASIKSIGSSVDAGPTTQSTGPKKTRSWPVRSAKLRIDLRRNGGNRSFDKRTFWVIAPCVGA